MGVLSRAFSGALRGVAAGLFVGAAPPQQTRASTRPLDVLVQVDALGYQCIPEAQLEAAFAASGKGAYLPRTCLKDPCAAEPEETLLAELLGREPTEDEIDEFRQRHIVSCTARGPKFPPGYEPYLVVLSTIPHSERPVQKPGSLPKAVFGSGPTPSIIPPLNPVFVGSLPPLSETVRPTTLPETSTTPATVFGGVPPGSEGGTPLTMQPRELPIIATSPPTPSLSVPPPAPVPLPQSLVLLLGALFGVRTLAVGKRRRV